MATLFNDMVNDKSYNDVMTDTSLVSSNSSVTMSGAVPKIEDEVAEGWTYNETYQLYNTQYVDPNWATLDDMKVISINGPQRLITQEINSQIIPFQIARFWEGVDLADKYFMVHYVNASNADNYDVPINFRYNDTHIRFYWLVSDFATASSGQLQFELTAIGLNAKDHRYVWKTVPNKTSLNVVASLYAAGSIERDQSWAEWLIGQVQDYAEQASKAYSDAKKEADLAKQNAEELGATAEQIQSTIETNVKADLDETYARKDELDPLSDLNVKFDPNAYVLTLFNEDEVIWTGNIQSEPTTTWAQNFEQYLVNDVLGSTTVIEDEQEKTVNLAYLKDKIDAYITSNNARVGDVEQTVAGHTADLTRLKGQIGEGKTYLDSTEIQNKLDGKVSTGELQTLTDKLQNTLGVYFNQTTGYSVESMLTEINQSISELQAGGTGGGTGTVNPEDLYHYRATYYDGKYADESKRYTFTLWEYTGEEPVDENGNFDTSATSKAVAVSSFKIIGGGGGGGQTAVSTVSILPVTSLNYVALDGSRVVIRYKYKSVDNDGFGLSATAVWRLGNAVIGTQDIVTGGVEGGEPDYAEYEFDITDYVTLSNQRFSLTVTDTNNISANRTWAVRYVDVRLTSPFNANITYTANEPITFTYVPYGGVAKTVFIILDDETIGEVTLDSSVSGARQQFIIPADKATHGSHLLEAYMTTSQFLVDGKPLETEHIFRDIIAYDSTSEVPVIGCSTPTITAKQYDTTTVSYSVYDPNTENPTIKIAVDGTIVSTQTVTNGTHAYSYKGTEVGEHAISFSCRGVVKTITVNVTKLNINVKPVTGGLALDFNPVGYSNNSDDRIWTNGTYKMTVSDNFDWTNGGYQLDDDGDQYFCVKAGTRATFDYKLFGTDAKLEGKEFKLIYRIENVRDISTTWLSSYDGEIGIHADPHNTYISSSAQTLMTPLSEEDLIEFEFNINPMGTDPNGVAYIPMLMTYEDGVALRPMIYSTATGAESFTQSGDKTDITIGSDDCDVHIYRMKCYATNLTDSEILDNFIADAKNAEAMVNRFNRNQIYDDNNMLDPDVLAEKCPDLRIIKISCPRFTHDKYDYVGKITTEINGESKTFASSVQCIHKNGDPVYGNWKFENVYVAGQGTTSNEYGAAGRNIDIIMRADGKNQIIKKIPLDESYITKLTLGNGRTITNGEGTEEAKVPLTPTSIPNNWFNIKVNIASSENANNALLQNRYNAFVRQLYQTPGQKKDNRKKNAMEFVNCVVFLQENCEDLSIHEEFKEDYNKWHFYAIGNIGDSKKTDATRASDPTDVKEFCVEFSDNDKPNATFSTGYDAPGNEFVYPISKSQFVAGNTAYDNLYDNWDGSFEFRYEMGGEVKDGQSLISEEAKLAQEEANKQILRDFYEFVITATNEEFTAHLRDWFIVDSAVFWYLFTERYTMIDNRAKNSFWHWCKYYITDAQAEEMGDEAQYYTIDNNAAAINEGYRFDLWDYDNDTALGINNSGIFSFSYGLEDIDKNQDGTWVFNGGQSVFWRRIRECMTADLRRVYQYLDGLGCWSADNLITQFDNWQSQFPEEVWRLDVERKYLRTFLGGGTSGKQNLSNERFLRNMMNGRKKFQRRQYERDQEKYMGTKYLATSVTSDQIMIRFTTPENTVVAPNYDLTIVPYSDMYLSVMFGNSTPTQVRAKAGQTYVVKGPTGTQTSTATLIYCASRIQEIADLSAGYIEDNDFSKAVKLKKLVIGNATEGYVNNSLKTLVIGDSVRKNGLLEYLDIRNCPNLTGSLDLSPLPNLQTFHAENTGLSGVSFATGGLIKEAYLPAINALSMSNLMHLETLSIADYTTLKTLVIENCPTVDSQALITAAVNLIRLRATGVDWDVQNDSWLKALMNLAGIDSAGREISQSVLTGTAELSGGSDTFTVSEFRSTWPDLDLVYDPQYILPAYTVTFRNPEQDPIAEHASLNVQHVIQGGAAVDPVAEGLIPTPTMVLYLEDGETISTDYTYSGWDSSFTDIRRDRTITAVYTESPHQYTATFVNLNGDTISRVSGPYGSVATYTGPIPTYTVQENVGYFNLFKNWKTYPILNKDITVEPVYETCNVNTLINDQTPLEEMRAVDVYALTRSRNSSYELPVDVEYGDTIKFKMGLTYDYDNVEKVNLFEEEKTFTGVNSDYVDTGIKLIDEDKDWIMALDFTFDTTVSTGYSPTGTVLMQCYQNSGKNGVRLIYNNGLKLMWGDSQVNVSGAGTRDMLVLRHVKGSDDLHVYSGNLPEGDIAYTKLTAARSVASGNTIPVSLVFGANKADNGKQYTLAAKGTIYSAKIYYTDIGDAACRNMAMWIGEEMEFELMDFNNYYLADNSGDTCAMTFLSKHFLSNPMSIGTTNVGGYHASPLKAFLNGRFYNSIPVEWRQIIKNVMVGSNKGHEASSTTEENAVVDIQPTYVTIPSIEQMYANASRGADNVTVYTDEAGEMNTEAGARGYAYPAVILSDSDSDPATSSLNIRTRTYPSGSIGEYYTRSPMPQYDNCWWIISGQNTDGTTGAGEPYYWYTAGRTIGILPEFSI